MSMKTRRRNGFTLIELMITVAIIGILLAVALPSYQEQVAKGKRTSARTVLLSAQQWMERFYSENYRYDKNLADVAISDSTLFPAQFSTAPPASEGNPSYTISLSVTSRSYTVTATPLGGMSSDRCGSYRVNHTGRKSVTGYTPEAGSTALEAARYCWK